jgi:hypothetical protein
MPSRGRIYRQAAIRVSWRVIAATRANRHFKTKEHKMKINLWTDVAFSPWPPQLTLMGACVAITIYAIVRAVLL